jgi:TonB family protein
MTLAFLVDCTIKATVIFILAAVAAGLARRGSAALRHQIWAVAMMCAVLLPLLAAMIPGWHPRPPEAALELWRVAVTGAGTTAAKVRATSVSATADVNSVSLALRWVPWIWLAGAAFVTMRLLAGLGRLAWMSSRTRPCRDDRFVAQLPLLARQLGVKRLPTLMVAQGAGAMPCTWGFRKPRILLPADCETWPEERMVMVLAHELAHISRCDWPVRLITECARCLYWFHPLAWIGASKLAEQGERACDDTVLASGMVPDRYARELLNLVRSAATSNNQWSLALAMAHTTNLERRFTAMLDSTLDRRRTTRRSLLFTTTTALLLLLPLAAVRLPGQEVSGRFSGAVYGPTGAALSNATIILTHGGASARYMTVSDATGAFEFSALPAGDYQVTVTKTGFVDYKVPHVGLEAARDAALNVNLDAGENPEVVPKSRVDMNTQTEAALLLTKVNPRYPVEAKAARVQGVVILDATINAQGVPESLRIVNPQADPALARAAVEAVNQWRYQPVLFNGDPGAIRTTIKVNFTLAE